MTEPSFNSIPNERSSGFQSTRKRVPVTSTVTGPASKRHFPGPWRCAIATSAEPFSTSTRAPFDVQRRARAAARRARGRSSCPRRSAAPSARPRSLRSRSPALPATAAGPRVGVDLERDRRAASRTRTAAATAATPHGRERDAADRDDPALTSIEPRGSTVARGDVVDETLARRGAPLPRPPCLASERSADLVPHPASALLLESPSRPFL